MFQINTTNEISCPSSISEKPPMAYQMPSSTDSSLVTAMCKAGMAFGSYPQGVLSYHEVQEIHYMLNKYLCLAVW
jgi:hypothetical protein